MKTLLIAVALAVSTTAMAQDMPNMPTTKDLVDGSGKKIGTAATWAGITVFRDDQGELLGSAAVSGPETVTFRDPDGKVTRTIETKDGKVILRNSAGEIVSTTKRR